MRKADEEAVTGTKEKILDSAQYLIQTRGYSAISYAHIAEKLGIRKASIHYYFPSKADLGVAVVERYTAMFEAALAQVLENEDLTNRQKIEAYFQPYRDYADEPEMVCLCGALAGEFSALPEEMQARTRQFFLSHQNWLKSDLTVGEENREFRLPGPPGKFARMMFAMLQGALLVKRSTGDISQMDDVIEMLRGQIVS